MEESTTITLFLASQKRDVQLEVSYKVSGGPEPDVGIFGYDFEITKAVDATTEQDLTEKLTSEELEKITSIVAEEYEPPEFDDNV